MKRYSAAQLLNLLGMPVLITLLGLVLLLSPDSASALIGKLLAWGILLAGIGSALGALKGSGRTGKLVSAILLLSAGLWLLRNPLFLAKFIGRVLGLILLLRGIQDFSVSRKNYPDKFSLIPGFIAVIGLILLVLPLTTSRLLFSAVGIVLICMGAGEACSRLRGQDNDPNIIDAL